MITAGYSSVALSNSGVVTSSILHGVFANRLMTTLEGVEIDFVIIFIIILLMFSKFCLLNKKPARNRHQHT